MQSTGLIALLLLVVLYGHTIYTDMRYRLIKNYITFPIMAAGLILLVIQHGIILSVAFFMLALALGILLEAFRIWGSGDTKLFTAAGMCSALLLGPDFLFLFCFMLANLILYIVSGHLYIFAKSKFNPLLYHINLKMDYIKAKVPAALFIFAGNVVAVRVILYL